MWSNISVVIIAIFVEFLDTCKLQYISQTKHYIALYGHIQEFLVYQTTAHMHTTTTLHKNLELYLIICVYNIH